MAQIEQSDKGGKKKKGAQKKMSIHVDFTPMVDMNMLLITFFMLCTTMIKSQTIKILLPAYTETQNYEKNQAKADLAMTLILDTEYDENGDPAKDENGNTKHRVYFYEYKIEEVMKGDKLERNGVPDLFDANVYGERTNPYALAVEEYKANNNGQPQGIRKVLRKRNELVMDKYDKLKEEYASKKSKKDQEDFKAKVLEIAKDTLNLPPTIIIKALPTSTYENVINAFDELEINKIRRYSFQNLSEDDLTLLENFQKKNPEQMKHLDLAQIRKDLVKEGILRDDNKSAADGDANKANPNPGN